VLPSVWRHDREIQALHVLKEIGEPTINLLYKEKQLHPTMSKRDGLCS